MKNYYVYLHKDPMYDTVVYVGKGCHGRAWDVTRCRGQHKEHQEWMIELSNFGWIPTDWVTIIAKGLTEKEAFAIESKWMHENGTPIYNRTGGEKNHQSKITDDQAREIYTLTKTTKTTHQELADRYGISRSAVSMIATRKQWKAATACLIK